MSPGTYKNVPFDEYRQWPFVSQSVLTAARESMRAAKQALDDPREPTDAMLAGQALHYALLEPAEFNRRVVCWTGGARRGSEWKTFLAQHGGKIVLTQNAYANVQTCAEEIRQHPDISKLRIAHVELSGLFPFDYVAGNWLCKFRLDAWVERDEFTDQPGIILDFKKVQTADPHRFAANAEGYGWFHQAAFYQEAMRTLTGYQPRVLIVAVEEKTQDVVVFEPRANDLVDCLHELTQLMAQFAHCQQIQTWPGRSREIVSLDRPAWGREKFQETALTND